MPLASYVSGQYGSAGGGLLSGLSRIVKYGLIGFMVVSVILVFVYLGSSFVATRSSSARWRPRLGASSSYRLDK